jgi:predicted kinase
MKQVIILKGLPASGKSTWAKQTIEENPGKYKRVNKDDLRAMLDNGKWSKENEKFVLSLRDVIIINALEDGKHVIVDDTNLAEKHEQHIRDLVKGQGEVIVKFFEIDVEEAIKRDLKRPISVGENVIRNMYEQFLKPKPEKYGAPENKPNAYIFDVDGTLAIMKKRNPYDWSMVETDKVNTDVKNILMELKQQGYKIIIFTGRDGVCEVKTKQWLMDNGIEYDYFDIRPEGNIEKDAIIKKRMFEKIKNDYCILGVFDDRNQVVEMWRSLGLTCFQVNNGNF